MFSSVIADDGDDSNIEKVDKELERCYLLDIGGPPEEAFVEILSYHRFFPEFQCLSGTKFGTPVTFFTWIVRRSSNGVSGRVRLPRSWISLSRR